MNARLQSKLQTLPSTARILDAGGWLNPLPFATHVVDMLPYETRKGGLERLPLPGERFDKSTWIQTDFLKKGFHLPFEDRFFDFSVCTHTIEDLENPTPLLEELQRVSRAGYIECPSRLSEQTIGIHDRTGSFTGYVHHHWIVERGEDGLELSSKNDLPAGLLHKIGIPLYVQESLVQEEPARAITAHFWDARLHWRLLSENENTARAIQLAASVPVYPWSRLADGGIRMLRKAKRFLKGVPAHKPEVWWQETLERSRPFSTLKL